MSKQILDVATVSIGFSVFFGLLMECSEGDNTCATVHAIFNLLIG
jgi:hypothetical protein